MPVRQGRLKRALQCPHRDRRSLPGSEGHRRRRRQALRSAHAVWPSSGRSYGAPASWVRRRSCTVTGSRCAPSPGHGMDPRLPTGTTTRSTGPNRSGSPPSACRTTARWSAPRRSCIVTGSMSGPSAGRPPGPRSSTGIKRSSAGPDDPLGPPQGDPAGCAGRDLDPPGVDAPLTPIYRNRRVGRHRAGASIARLGPTVLPVLPCGPCDRVESQDLSGSLGGPL